MSGRVIVANACSCDNSLSRQLYYMKFGYEIGSRCMGRGDRWGDSITWRYGSDLLRSTLTLSHDTISYLFLYIPVFDQVKRC